MKLKDYNTDLKQRLLDLEEAGAYLTACYEDSHEVFLLGLRQVVDAHGGISALADTTNLNRENLYRILSENGNPQISSLGLILEGLGIGLEFKVIGSKAGKGRA